MPSVREDHLQFFIEACFCQFTTTIHSTVHSPSAHVRSQIRKVTTRLKQLLASYVAVGVVFLTDCLQQMMPVSVLRRLVRTLRDVVGQGGRDGGVVGSV